MDPVLKEKNEHLFSLKVMCLTRPSFITPTIITSDQKDLPGQLFNDILRKDITTVPGSETIAASSFLLLPQSFKDIYLGETFSCYVCIHNHSNHVVKGVTLKVHLETPKENCFRIIKQPKDPIDLAAGCNIDEVIHHEVKEIGNHVLLCEVNYRSVAIPDEDKSLKKTFQFKVHKPLDIKTNLYASEPEEIYLEAEVQNITSDYMVLENVLLEASPLFNVENLSTQQKIDSLNLNIMASEESKHFLYCMTLKNYQNNRNLKAMTDKVIGKLDIVWRSNLGEKGHLQTSPIPKKPSDVKDLLLGIDELPSLVYLEEMFSITLRLSNITLQ
ncbi:trafficking protein particle complex subunit 13 isoform X2 [Cimex lectularius]|uniref:Trafficking protein particle complex subunit 13 n=1 Tax=Cimex lectularius TaxID=79782 RepID=A0A8I6RLT6_CIMLE|nr:trafficking protein particle complex subunit 13 isoform X2 [Cimex lectularius]